MITRNIVDGIVATHGQHFVSGKEAIAHNVSRRIKMFFGEYFLDRTDGTKMINSVLGKSSQIQREEELKRRILTAPLVESIVSFSLTQDDRRKLSCSVTISTIEGEINISEAV